MPNREQLIRERAYVLWEQEGCPDGRADVHWCMAAEQIGNQAKPRRQRVVRARLSPCPQPKPMTKRNKS
jgi:Protein of unknown function (DUF2934)